MELVNLTLVFLLVLVVSVALAKPQLLIIRKHCIDGTCTDVPIVNMRYILGYSPSAKQKILRMLGIGIAIAVLALIIYIAFKLAS